MYKGPRLTSVERNESLSDEFENITKKLLSNCHIHPTNNIPPSIYCIKIVDIRKIKNLVTFYPHSYGAISNDNWKNQEMFI